MKAENALPMTASIAQVDWQTMTIQCPLCNFFLEYDVQISVMYIDGVTTLEIIDGGEAKADDHSCDPK